MNTIYRQVELQRASAGQVETQVCWLPLQFATKGKVVALKDDPPGMRCFGGSLPVKGWVVVNAYGPLSTAQQLDRQRASRKDLKSIIVPEDP
jgi:hypothetical protein